MIAQDILVQTKILNHINKHRIVSFDQFFLSCQIDKSQSSVNLIHGEVKYPVQSLNYILIT